MKQKFRNLKFKLIAIWWLITRKNYYLLAYNSRTSKSLESYNVVLPEFVAWVQKNHGMMTNEDIIKELGNIDSIYAFYGIQKLIAKLKKQ